VEICFYESYFVLLYPNNTISTRHTLKMNNILEELNVPQQEAVIYCDGPQLVIAGAGSGKTRVLTYKIAHLLNLGLEPWGILALTFTNKAAREMKERIAKLVGNDRARYLNMGTFHSIFSRILRAEAQHIGFTSDFTIYDQSDSRSLIKNIIKEMKLDDKKYKPAAVAERISMAKNHLITAHSYGSNSTTIRTDMEHRMPEISKIYINYAERCRQANAMDFDDLLLYTYRLFADNEDVRRKYSERFKYILVDEYQDTNKAQQAIVMQLARENMKVCVVGDDAQSIYSFRGANIDNILDFQTTFTGTKLFKLERNYRSTQNIVKAANSLIKHNQRQIPKDVFSENEGGERVKLKQAYSDKEEAAIVCRDIEYYKRNDHSEYSDFAILYRTNSQSRSFEEELRRNGIPYRIYGGLSFYQRKEIKDIIAYMRLAVNPSDEEAFRRIINYPARGIGDTTLSKIIAAANDHEVSLWATICNPEVNGLNVSKGTITKLNAFQQLASSWMERVAIDDAFTLGKNIIVESGIRKDIYSGRESEDIARQENVEEFLAGLQEFVESRREQDMGNHVMLSDFLQEVSLLSDLDSDKDDSVAKVNLMTVHSAKGLEFATVFVVGLEENIFPSQMCSTLREIEEERRLLYVAITRAEKHCILTYAQNRWRYGRMEFDSPSRFIRDIDPRLLDYGKGEPAKPKATERPTIRKIVETGTRQIDNSLYHENAISPNRDITPTPSTAPLQPGMTIEHQRFGIGKVLEVIGVGENTKATVNFRNTGTKQLLLKFAKYKIIGVFIIALVAFVLSSQSIAAQNNCFGIDNRLYKIFEEADKKRAEPEALEIGKKMYKEAVRIGDKKAQAIASTIAVNYYGYKNDEQNLEKSVAESRRISKQCGYMDYYYFSWCRLISYYLISSKSYKGLEEAISLKNEAMRSKVRNHYGVYNSIRILGDFY